MLKASSASANTSFAVFSAFFPTWRPAPTVATFSFSSVYESSSWAADIASLLPHRKFIRWVKVETKGVEFVTIKVTGNFRENTNYSSGRWVEKYKTNYKGQVIIFEKTEAKSRWRGTDDAQKFFATLVGLLAHPFNLISSSPSQTQLFSSQLLSMNFKRTPTNRSNKIIPSDLHSEKDYDEI